MIDFEHLKTWFPEKYRQKQYARFIYREFFQYMILDFLANSKYAPKICFIGGTNLRLIHGIDRFSEDLDFDHKNMTREDFMAMTDAVVLFLKKSGYKVKTDDKEKDKALNAFRRNIVFTEFLYDNKLSAFKDEKFLIKIESQDQGISYAPDKVLVKGCGYVFVMNVPPIKVLCSMKISALLNRKKGRDFFDAMFLLGKTEPDYNFLSVSAGIDTFEKLKKTLMDLSENVNIKHKAKDFSHLLLNDSNANRILLFKEFVQSL